jgi:hypothetical protein
MKIVRRSCRHALILLAAPLLAAPLLAAGALAGGAGALASRAPTARHGHGVSRAAALAFFRHRGGALAAARGRGGGVAGGLPGVPSVPTPGTSSQLAGVFCTSAGNCWAVGSYQTPEGQLNQVLHWNGAKWSRVTVPNPAGTGTNVLNELFGVRCAAASDCWAVGDARKNNQADLDQALHWNGKTWSKVATPTPAGTLSSDFNTLFDVVCTSSTRCWAVGNYGTSTSSSEVILNQLLRWNGTKWSAVTVPNPGGTADGSGNDLASVRCTSATNCLAVGSYGTISPFSAQNQALRWNGSKWSTG